MTDKPNVLLLTVEALRPDRTSLHGYDRSTTPVLDRLAKNAIVCENCISLAAFTQPALSSLFTSSRPLSWGGYDFGAMGRPPSIFRAFQDAGYRTVSITNFPWVSRYYGYDGLDREDLIFVLNALVGASIHTIRNQILAYRSRSIDFDAFIAMVSPTIRKLMRDIDDYCADRLRHADRDHADMGEERFIRDGYDLERVREIAATHTRAFEVDPRGYIETHFKAPPEPHEWIAAEWRYARGPRALIGNGFNRVLKHLIQPLAPSWATLRDYRQKRYVDATVLADRVISAVAEHDRKKPLFLWTQFNETHVPYCPGEGPAWYRTAGRYLAETGYSRDLDPAIVVSGKPTSESGWVVWSAYYDAAVRYVDEQIGRIVDALDRTGLADTTLIVVCGDHGEELGDHGDITHHYRLYEHNLRVPLLFHSRSMMPSRVSGLTTLMDLAPSLAELSGIEAPQGWEGTLITNPSIARRRHVVAETFHGGSCLFAHRPPYLAVRTPRWKYLWKEYRDPSDRYSPEGLELYDIAADPHEQQNIYRADHPAVVEFNSVIARRLAEIPEIGAGRIDAAFGSAWRVSQLDKAAGE